MNKKDNEVEVTLIRPHAHNGISLPAGTKIDVTKDDAEWLKKYGVIADAPNKPSVTAEPKQA